MNLAVITLTDTHSGATAKFLPGYGMNCFSWNVPFNSAPRELLWSAPNFETEPGRPSGSGIPLLFPFPGRLQGKSFEYHGKTYPLSLASENNGNAIHGFVLDRPWEVIEQTPTKLSARFHAAKVEPKILEQWPADFILTCTYEIAGNQLSSHFQVENPSDDPLPFGLGTHPYFRVPLASNSSADQCVIRLAAADRWEMPDMLPSTKTIPVSGDFDVKSGVPFQDAKFDTLFTNLTFTNGHCSASIEDPGSRQTLSIHFDETMPHHVLYNPPHREAICLEPYSTVPDAFNLIAKGIDPGLRTLSPGDKYQTTITMKIE